MLAKASLAPVPPGAGFAGLTGGKELSMVLTLELPIRPAAPDPLTNPHARYESRFGALPAWLDELSNRDARSLLHHALQRGAPLVPADLPY